MHRRAPSVLLQLHIVCIHTTMSWLVHQRADAALLLDEDFSCQTMGCFDHHITNLSYWRHSTTGSNQSYLSIGSAGAGRSGNAVNFSVSWCRPPSPNPQHLGCYRSELALQRDVQDTMIDWKSGEGSSERCTFAILCLRIAYVDSSPTLCRVWLLQPVAGLLMGDHDI